MTSKIAKAAMAGAHTAGIYADMTVDGPVIGDLVVNIDRAKNLPNRRTMGKQDPYCAARLGKDAQKTPTDKRGGQTPRWDHELRFTVHDSPDYRQLKVSVFNDDKKTDLIGEAWVSLEDILLRGGGEREGWNSLNFKGRYAGEIWIELTYWDTRPREDKPPTPSSSTPSPLHHERSTEAVGGPRQLKPVKRRPLPADPTSNDSSPIRPTLPEHTQSSPLPYIPPRGSGRLHGPSPHSANTPARHHTQPPPIPPQEEEPLPKSFSQPMLGHYDEPHQRPRDELHFDANPISRDMRLEPRQNGHNVDSRSTYDYTGEPEPIEETIQHLQYSDLELPELPPHTPRNQRPTSQISPRHYSHPDSNSSPAYTLPNYGPSPGATHFPTPERGVPSAPPSMRNDQYMDGHARHETFDEYARHAVYPSVEDDEPPPPPPPVHRTSGMGMSSFDNPHTPQYAPPINTRGVRGSVSASPLAQNFTQLSEDDNFGYSPTEIQVSSRSAPMPSHDQYDQPRRLSDRGDMPVPPQMYGQHAQPYASHDYNMDQQIHRPQPHRGSMGTSPYSTPPNRGRPAPDPRYPSSTDHDDYWSSQSQRSSAPIIKPRAVSSDPRTPQRKSVSPQPPASRDSLSGVPFSPDSYDQLNPNLKNAKSINNHGPKYNTPEGAREAARERDKEDELAKGPIIDHRGNVVDPSDHLPTDTWAPEPERKAPRKSHQINIKFKHSPHGAQASGPRPPRENVRPYSMSAAPATAPAPIQHAYTADDVSTTSSGGRNRLQKKSRVAQAAYSSSPMLPKTSQGQYQTPSPQQQAYPLREHPNYGYGNSPSYQRSSPMGAGVGPPPIPAKVPLGGGQEDWGMDRLGEEIRGIDIGVGSGGRRRGNGRYGG
ncbi:MAG: hypothetical protein MMC23_009801 [Stictis urceolatum]|nr:hypothetical protein [Stictis urceolata]